MLYRSNFSLIFSTLNEQRVDFQVTLQAEKLSQTGQVIVAAVILVGVYVLIGFDVSLAIVPHGCPVVPCKPHPLLTT